MFIQGISLTKHAADIRNNDKGGRIDGGDHTFHWQNLLIRNNGNNDLCRRMTETCFCIKRGHTDVQIVEQCGTDPIVVFGEDHDLAFSCAQGHHMADDGSADGDGQDAINGRQKRSAKSLHENHENIADIHDGAYREFIFLIQNYGKNVKSNGISLPIV